MSPSSISSALLFAGLSLSANLHAATITNPSFETDTNYTVFPGYQSGNNGGVLTGWTTSDPTRTGLNTISGPFANNGTIPQGNQAGFVQSASSVTPTVLSNTITGLTVGQVYRLTWQMTARNNGVAANQRPNGTVTVGGTSVTFQAAPVEGVNAFTQPYRTGVLTFTATATTQSMSVSNVLIATIAGQTDNTLVVDNFTVTNAAATKWSAKAWTDDAASGIQSTLTYTHAYNFGTALSAVSTSVNGVNFTGVPGANPAVAGSFATTGWTDALDDAANNLNAGGSAALADGMLYGGAGKTSQTLSLEGLTVGTPYRLTIFGVGWADANTPNRTMLFDDGSNDLVILNEQQFGVDNGVRIELEYTPTSTSKTFTLNPTATPSTFHLYGFSNAAVPEPGSISVLALAALGLGLRRRR